MSHSHIEASHRQIPRFFPIATNSSGRFVSYRRKKMTYVESNGMCSVFLLCTQLCSLALWKWCWSARQQGELQGYTRIASHNGLRTSFRRPFTSLWLFHYYTHSPHWGGRRAGTFCNCKPVLKLPHLAAATKEMFILCKFQSCGENDEIYDYSVWTTK